MENDQKATILNVDDDDAGRYAISRTLRQAGFDVKEASNGREALRLAEEQPDLIILDVNLPDINGFEVCRMIKNNPLTSHIPVLYLSATYLDDESKVRGLETADGYLTEPVEPPVLIATVKASLRMKRAEESLRESEGRYRSLFDNMLDGFAYCRMLFEHNRPQDFIYLDVNNAFKKLTGLKNVVGKKVTEVIPGIRESNPEMFEIYGRVALTGIPERFEVYLESLGAWLSISAYSTGKEYFVATFDDITERKLGEAELIERELFNFALFEYNPIQTIVVDLEGKVIKFNLAKKKSGDRLPNIGDVMYKDYAGMHEIDMYAELMKCIRSGEGKEFPEQKYGNKALSITISPFHKGAVIISQDITEREQAEDERDKLLADFEVKNRELEAFVYTISHDLKAPLVSMDGFCYALQKEYESQLGKEGKHYLERIQGNVAHMDGLIVSLLELSRIGRVVGPIEEIDVGPLLREIRDRLAVKLKEAGAEFVVLEPLPTVRADRGRIHQVFVNLIDNAVKYRSAERVLHIEVGCRQEARFYRFHVADNGLGIAPQYQEQIFAPFRKLHPEIEGVGIGLALVKKIVEHHGGRVWVESEAGKGSTFYFTIPRG